MKRHLDYPSVEAWLEGEGLTVPILQIADPEERDRRIAEYGELRRHLFANHVETLSAEEQRQFDEGTHPSQSHSFADRAQAFLPLLQEHLARLGLSAHVSLGWYHMDRIVLSVDLSDVAPECRSNLPWLFRGFEVKYYSTAGKT